MKNLFRSIAFLAMGFLLIACGQSVTATPSPIPIISATVTITLTPVPSQTATATIEPTPRPVYVPPTLIPTIDPALLPDLLSKTLSIQTVDSINGHKTRRITGWNLGFAGGFCSSYDWLDTNHLLIHPVSGQGRWGEGSPGINISFQPVVVNVDTGNFWLPPSNQSESPSNCGQLNWSRELKILITTETHDGISAVSTYTYDGTRLASYPGTVVAISPSRTKVLITENTLIDLRTNKIINLNWSLEDYYEPINWGLYWTSDETRIYRCCYLYADLVNGKSFRFTESDFLDSQGNPLNYKGLWMYRGEWVLDDKYFLVQWSWIDDGDMRYIPMFDPAKKIFYDVREMAGISPDLTCPETNVSPNGKYLWILCWGTDYLVNLSNFETTVYPKSSPEYSSVDIDWSEDSKFAWYQTYDSINEGTVFQMFCVSDQKFCPLPVAPLPESEHWGHPTDNIVVYPAKDKNALIFLDLSTMAFRELLFKDQDSRYKISNFAWNPNGDKLIFITENNILWQVDYPALENLEQIMASTHTISGAQWSPEGDKLIFVTENNILWQVDYPALENLEQIIVSTNTIGGAQYSPNGKSISFLNGSDIYIVDILK